MGVLNYYDLLAQANLQDCDPHDSVCVANNTAKQAAVEDLWVTKYIATGAPDDLKLNFAPLSPSALNELYDPTLRGGNVVDIRGIITNPPAGYRPPTSPGGAGSNVGTTSDMNQVVPPPKSSGPTPATTPQGDKIINSSGASQPDGGSNAPASGFSVASIPLWGWALAAGVALFAFGGARGR